jgi:excisionase family DNA binding protein
MSKNLQIPQRRAFSIRETERAVNLSHSTIYRLIAAGKLTTVKVGARRLVPIEAIDALLREGASMTTEEEAPRVSTEKRQQPRHQLEALRVAEAAERDWLTCMAFTFTPKRPAMTRCPSDLKSIARALGGEVIGSQVLAPGPGHSAKDRSMSVRLSATARDGFLVFSHSGDDFAACRAYVKQRLGLDGDEWRNREPKRDHRGHSFRPHAHDARVDRNHTAWALRIWGQTADVQGSLAETYLASRGIVVLPVASLRFHCRLKHPAGSLWPAMVALITDGVSGKPQAIHRTFLARDGRGKAPVDTQKMMLGPTRGGAVRLAEPGETLMIGEGLETCLSAMQATGMPAWAALSTAGLNALDLPPNVRDVIVLADGDDAGERTAVAAARRWKNEGRRVRIARPPRGLDFNDIAVRAATAREVA